MYQLHRDSTVGNLTLTPSLKDGVLAWEDSPLVRAATEGRTLVIDEADKAPLEVVAVIKSLVEDGEMLLADGRRLLSQRQLDLDEEAYQKERDKGMVIPIHENFHMWILANRPGYPFLGEPLFSEIGDVFAIHVIPNPDLESEMELLSKYAPGVDVHIVQKIVAAFASLREKADLGELQYPFSTREAVAVVKHLQKFPDDSLLRALENVLHFDWYNRQSWHIISEVMEEHGLPLNVNSTTTASSKALADNDDEEEFDFRFKVDLGEEITLPPPISREKWSVS